MTYVSPLDDNGDPMRRLAHDIRGRMNAMKLCVAALGTPMEPAEAQEFLDDVDRLCEKIDALMDDLEHTTASGPRRGSSLHA